MKSTNVFDFIEEIVPAANLVEGVDYEIISFFVEENLEFYPVNRYCEMDVLSLFSKNKEDMAAQRTVSATFRGSNMITPTPSPNEDARLFKLSCPIDYDTAISLGFGIIRLLKGSDQNEFFLYFFMNEDDDDEVDPLENLIDEMMMLKCYLQVACKDFHAPNLVDYIEENLDYLYLLMFCDQQRMIERIFMSFDRKKGELVVFPK